MTREEILSRHELDPTEVKRRADEEARQRRIAGAKWKREQRANAAKATHANRARRDRFMSGVGKPLKANHGR